MGDADKLGSGCGGGDVFLHLPVVGPFAPVEIRAAALEMAAVPECGSGFARGYGVASMVAAVVGVCGFAGGVSFCVASGAASVVGPCCGCSEYAGRDGIGTGI